jgi:hypothetical protein
MLSSKRRIEGKMQFETADNVEGGSAVAIPVHAERATMAAVALAAVM